MRLANAKDLFGSLLHSLQFATFSFTAVTTTPLSISHHTLDLARSHECDLNAFLVVSY